MQNQVCDGLCEKEKKTCFCNQFFSWELPLYVIEAFSHLGPLLKRPRSTCPLDWLG